MTGQRHKYKKNQKLEPMEKQKQEENQNNKENAKLSKEYSTVIGSFAALSQLGFIMAATVIACALLGHWIDNKLGTGALFLMIFIILGFIAGLISAYRQYMMVTNKKSRGKG